MLLNIIITTLFYAVCENVNLTEFDSIEQKLTIKKIAYMCLSWFLFLQAMHDPSTVDSITKACFEPNNQVKIMQILIMIISQRFFDFFE